MRAIDLHVHTTASDGSMNPMQVAELAVKAGLSAIAITDHDTVLGCKEAMEAGDRLGLEVVPGIEFGTKFHASVHMLGYYMDLDSPYLTKMTRGIVEDRDDRNRKTVKLLNDDGIIVSFEQMKQRFGEVIGRPHFARILIEHGLCDSVDEAFKRYLNRGMKYYMMRTTLNIGDTIECILASGGVPVLAHPFQYKLEDEGLRELIEHCMDFGLRGMECRYSGYDIKKVKYLEALAEEYGLIKTGGSDYHGEPKPHISIGHGIEGELDVPYSWLRELKAAAGK